MTRVTNFLDSHSIAERYGAHAMADGGQVVHEADEQRAIDAIRPLVEEAALHNRLADGRLAPITLTVEEGSELAELVADFGAETVARLADGIVEETADDEGRVRR